MQVYLNKARIMMILVEYFYLIFQHVYYPMIVYILNVYYYLQNYFQGLPHLKKLWLEENPCVEMAGPKYVHLKNVVNNLISYKISNIKCVHSV